MGYIRGKPLEPGEKRAIVCVKGYFDRNKKEFGLTEGSVQLTADALEVSLYQHFLISFKREMQIFSSIQRPWREHWIAGGLILEKERGRSTSRKRMKLLLFASDT